MRSIKHSADALCRHCSTQCCEAHAGSAACCMHLPGMTLMITSAQARFSDLMQHTRRALQETHGDEGDPCEQQEISEQMLACEGAPNWPGTRWRSPARQAQCPTAERPQGSATSIFCRSRKATRCVLKPFQSSCSVSARSMATAGGACSASAQDSSHITCLRARGCQ